MISPLAERLHEAGILAGQFADAVEVLRRHGLRLDELAADAETAGARLQERRPPS